MLHYTLDLSDPKGHYFDVTLQFEHTKSDLLELYLPAWIPGSYLIREFARNVIEFHAQADGRACPVKKLSKDRWQISQHPKDTSNKTVAMECSWRIYAWDLSVRGAHLDESHAFLNGTSAFLIPKGLEDQAICLSIHRPFTGKNKPSWNLACGLKLLEENHRTHGCVDLAEGHTVRFEASNYDELIDHPLEMGELQTGQFLAYGVEHYFAVYGADADLDLERICKDLKPVCEAQIDLFEPHTQKVPFTSYWFLLHATDNGYGGLEHRNSTALLCSRKDLPQKNVAKAPEGYDTFMGLCSHEYFHSWNVKRIKPAAFTPYDLSQESYTELLWVFEGFTSYYDDLMLARVGYLDEAGYLKALGKSIDQVAGRPGRLVQTVAESSFDAWTKYYRQDENAPNAIVSYYAKGALVAFCLDASIRARTANTKSLDDVMRLMWKKHGLTGIGLDEQSMPELIQQATQVDLSKEVFEWTQTTTELPLEACLQQFGFLLEGNLKEQVVYLGVNGTFNEEGMKVKQVINSSPAHAAGISAGDILVAIGDRKLTETHYKRAIQSLSAGNEIQVIGFRAERLCFFDLVLEEARPKAWGIQASTEAPVMEKLPAPWQQMTTSL